MNDALLDVNVLIASVVENHADPDCVSELE